MNAERTRWTAGLNTEHPPGSPLTASRTGALQILKMDHARGRVDFASPLPIVACLSLGSQENSPCLAEFKNSVQEAELKIKAGPDGSLLSRTAMAESS